MSHLHSPAWSETTPGASVRQVQVLRGVAPWAPRRSNLLIFLFILISCAPVPTTIPSPTIASTPTVFEPIPTPTSTAVVRPTLTPAPVTLTPIAPTPVTCDPFTTDFCITDGHLILQRPIKPPANDSVDVAYPYGSTAHGTRDSHRGVEFANPSGTPVYAAADGEVIFAGPDEEAIYSPWRNYYGNLVVIGHAGGLFTLYAHLSKINAYTGQTVLAGEQIGEVGSTGTAMGSHLHFEVRQGNAQDYSATRNPGLWLAPKPDGSGGFLGALMISVVDGNFDFQSAEFTMDYHPSRNQPREKSFYISTYAPEMMGEDENAALGDLPPGDYRIAVNHNGQLYERWVEVESGKLTQVVFVVQ